MTMQDLPTSDQGEQRLDIVCFSSQPWDDPTWTNKQHIMSRLSINHRVLYIDLELDWLRFFKRVIRGEKKWWQFFKWLQHKSTNLWVLSPILLPLGLTYGLSWLPLRTLNSYINLWIIRLALKKLGFRNPVLWTYQPDTEFFIGKLGESIVCYDCVDDISAFPEYQTPRRNREIVQAEYKLLKKADIVFATAPKIYEDKKRINPFTFYVPNVGDANHFAKAACVDIPVNPEIVEIQKPIIGYVGTLASYKVDFNLIRTIASEHPKWNIVLIGKIASDAQNQYQLCNKISNIHFLGMKPYQRLPEYIKGFDVCIIPYNINTYTDSCYPIKLHEYLASGKPVVSTDLPALREFENVIGISSNYQQFGDFIASALKGDNPEAVKMRMTIASEHSWDKRVTDLMSILHQRMMQL